MPEPDPAHRNAIRQPGLFRRSQPIRTEAERLRAHDLFGITRRISLRSYGVKMPGKAGTLEPLALQVGLALQPLESQLTSDGVLPFLAQLGLQFPPALLQSSFVTSLNAAATAAGALSATLTQLATDITNDDESAIVNDGLKLIQEIGSLISTLPQIGTEIQNLS